MNNRWYDSDPTLSMAISLLQNTSPLHQEMAAKYIFRLLEKDYNVSNSGFLPSDKLRYIFPMTKRSRLERHARQLLEVLKHQPKPVQQEAALNLINYIYTLDSEMHCLEADAPTPAAEARAAE